MAKKKSGGQRKEKMSLQEFLQDTGGFNLFYFTSIVIYLLHFLLIVLYTCIYIYILVCAS